MKKVLIIVFIILIPLITFTLIDNYFSEKSNLYLEKEITTTISNVLADAIVLSNITSEADDLLQFKYNTEGKISSIFIDSTKTNKIISSTNTILSRLLKEGTLENSIQAINLPIGILLSRALFTTIGPSVRIEVLPITSYKTDIVTNLVNYGINNSLFEVYLKIDVDVETIIHLKQTKIAYTTNLLLASSIIRGEVPYYYYLGEGTIQSLPI